MRPNFPLLGLTVVVGLGLSWTKTPASFLPGPGVQDGARRQDPAPALQWLEDLQLAEARARATGKPMLVVFRCKP